MTPIDEPSNNEHVVTLYALIAARIEQLNQAPWTAVVFAWLARYDGISRCYFEDVEATPTQQVLHCLRTLEPGVTDQGMAEALSHLEFLCWRVRHTETGERWDPLAGSLIEFIGAETPPNCWKWAGCYPSSAAIATWLLDLLPPR